MSRRLNISRPDMRPVVFAATLAALIVSALACASPLSTGPTAFITVAPDPSVTVSPDDMRAAGDVIKKRLDAAGLNHGVDVGDTQVKIYMIDTADEATVAKLATQTGAVVFFASDTALETGGSAPVDAQPILTDADIASARARPSSSTNTWQIDIKFTDHGDQALADFTAGHIGTYLVVAQDGLVLTSPQIMAAVTGGEVVIAGSFDEASARLLAAELTGGRLPLELTPVDAGLITSKP